MVKTIIRMLTFLALAAAVADAQDLATSKPVPGSLSFTAKQMRSWQEKRAHITLKDGSSCDTLEADCAKRMDTDFGKESAQQMRKDAFIKTWVIH